MKSFKYGNWADTDSEEDAPFMLMANNTRDNYNCSNIQEGELNDMEEIDDDMIQQLEAIPTAEEINEIDMADAPEMIDDVDGAVEIESVDGMKMVAFHVTGVVKWFSVKLGYGFINRRDNHEDVFIHYKSIIRNNPRKRIRSVGDGEIVLFNVVDEEKGKAAIDVTGPNGKPVKGSPYAANFRPNRGRTNYRGRGRRNRGRGRGRGRDRDRDRQEIQDADNHFDTGEISKGQKRYGARYFSQKSRVYDEKRARDDRDYVYDENRKPRRRYGNRDTTEDRANNHLEYRRRDAYVVNNEYQEEERTRAKPMKYSERRRLEREQRQYVENERAGNTAKVVSKTEEFPQLGRVFRKRTYYRRQPKDENNNDLGAHRASAGTNSMVQPNVKISMSGDGDHANGNLPTKFESRNPGNFVTAHGDHNVERKSKKNSSKSDANQGRIYGARIFRNRLHYM